ncbi:MAG: hypothetical protein JXI43_06660 [Tissierellales bacterium]|nr:hypothetical protein [Tissierellales bacterium]
MENNSNIATANNDNELVKIEQFDKANLNKEFTKIGKTNALLSQIPSLLAAHQASSCYKVIMPPGTTAKLMQYKNGLLGTPLVKNGTVVGHAGLQSASALVSPMLIFTAVSTLTGQYFLAEINNSIQNVIKEIEEIKDIILLKEESLLFACSSSLQRITANFSQITQSDTRKTATFVTVQNDINKLSASIYFYSHQIINIFSKLARDPFDKKACMTDTAKELTELTQKMLTAIDLRKMFIVLEFVLSESFDPITIKQTTENIKEENGKVFSPIIQEITKIKKYSSEQLLQKATNLRKQEDLRIIFNCFDNLEEKINSRLIPNYNKDVEQAFLKLSKTNNEELEYIIVEDEVYIRQTT